MPHNACLIVCGKLSGGTESILTHLNGDVETSFIKHGYNEGHRPPGWIRPIVETESGVRKSLKTCHVVVPVPGDNGTRESITMVFKGPQVEDFVDVEVLIDTLKLDIAVY